MNRRTLVKAIAAGSATATLSSAGHTAQTTAGAHRNGGPKVITGDGTALYVQAFGAGRPVVFVSAWTLDSRFWGSHMVALAKRGFRCVAFDRRGHGRSDAPLFGYDADTLAGDLAAVLDECGVRDAVLVAHSMGSGEVARYLARFGTERVSKLLLVAPTTPHITQTPDNPEGVPEQMVRTLLDSVTEDFPEWIEANEAPFFTPQTGSGTRAWIKSMMLSVPLPIAATLREQAARTDFRQDLQAIHIPCLILHGDKDASAPLPLTGIRTQQLIAGSKLEVYPGAPHALPLTHRVRFLADLEQWARSGQ